MSAALALVEQPDDPPDATELVGAYMSARLWPPAMTRTIRAALRSFVAHHADAPVAAIDRATVEAWLTTRNQEITPATAYNYAKIVRRWISWLVAEGHLEHDPWARPPKPRRQPRPQPTPDSPLHRLAERYIREQTRRGHWAPSTARSARYVLGPFCRQYGQRPVNMLGRAFIGQWLDTLGACAPGSRRTSYGTVRGFCTWLVAEGHLQRDPFHGHRRPKVPRRLPRGLATADVAKLFAAAGDDRRMRLVLSLMVQEGLRVHEVAKLELGDLDLGQQTIRIVGKGGHERILPITPATIDALRTYLGSEPMQGAGVLVRSRGNGWYEPQRTSNGITSMHLGQLVSDLMLAAGVKVAAWDRVAAHSLRHTAATDMLRRGAHVRDVQAVLGHADLSSTQIYLPLVVDDLRTAMVGRVYDGAVLGPGVLAAE